MPGVKVSDCRPGDVILFYGVNVVSGLLTTSTLFKTLTVLPAMLSADRGGNAFTGKFTANHAGILCGTPPALEIAHATNESGVHRVDFARFCEGSSGTLQVFRLDKTLEYFAGLAAQVARTWATQDSKGVGMKFATDKATCSAFSNISFGSGAKARAAFYRTYKDTRGGPPDLKHNDGSHKSMFCSMFVVACYQASMEDRTIEQVLGVDAKHTCPVWLDGYLRKSSHWDTIGAIAATPAT